MTAPAPLRCVVCDRECGGTAGYRGGFLDTPPRVYAVLTVIGPWCGSCYSDFRAPSSQLEGRRGFLATARAQGFRV